MSDNVISIAVVTGGGHGIGRALCRRLASDGTTIVVADIDGDAARTVAAEIGGIAMQIDVCDESAMSQLVDDVETDIGPIDMFISNAGVAFGDGDSGAISKEGGLNPVADRWETCWNVNVMAQVYAARAVIPRMLKRGGGHVINVASAAGLLSQIGDSAYSTSKHASVGFSESLAIDYGDEGIKVSVVCPQAVATRLIGMPDDSNAPEGGFGGNEVDGILKAEDVADTVIDQALEGRFMIVTHPQAIDHLQRKASDYDRWIGGMRKFRRSLAK
jgi:NAD(P)-dependent dehydrogenase (short-subunit alcohol dehydrogenase family)